VAQVVPLRLRTGVLVTLIACSEVPVLDFTIVKRKTLSNDAAAPVS
jgi:hypothetical protein